MIVLVLVLLLSTGLIIVLRNSMSSSDDSDCKQQVIASSLAVKYSKNLGAPTIKCPTKLLSATADNANQVIADQMKRCWDIFGKGQLPLFGDKGGVYCHICSSISVDNPVSGLGEYMDKHQATDTQTYSQFLTLTTTGDYFKNVKDKDGKSLAPVVFPQDKPIGVIFYYAKGQTFLQSFYNDVFGQPGTGMAVGVFGVGALAATAGAGVPMIIVLGTGGGVVGGTASIFTRNDYSTMAMVYARPMTEADIKSLGCQYAPVKN